MNATALQLIQQCLKAEAMTTADAVTSYFESVIEREFCDARGLRLVDRDVVLEVEKFVAHDGDLHLDLRVPVRVLFDTGRISPLTGKPARGRADTKNGRGVVEVDTSASAKDIIDAGGVRRVPRTSSYFVMYKSTLCHEFTHVLDVVCGIPRFKVKIEKDRIPGETPEQYRVRYHTSAIESRAFTRQLLHVLSIRLDAKFTRMGGMARPKVDDVAERDTLLSGTPEEALAVAVKLKLVPVKLAPWLENISKPSAPPEIKANLLRELAQLQALFRKRYSQAVYHGA